MQKCRARTNNGATCGADVQAGKDVCVFHDPTKAAKVRKARRAGGVRRSRPALLAAGIPDYPLDNMTQVSTFLGDAINRVGRGELDPRVANSMGYLAGVLLRALEQGPAEARMARIEAKLGIGPNRQTSSEERPDGQNFAQSN
jgi:hypothetical protein